MHTYTAYFTGSKQLYGLLNASASAHLPSEVAIAVPDLSACLPVGFTVLTRTVPHRLQESAGLESSR